METATHLAIHRVIRDLGWQDQEAGPGSYAASLISEYTNTHNSLLNLTARTFTAAMPGDSHNHTWQNFAGIPSSLSTLLQLCLLLLLWQ